MKSAVGESRRDREIIPADLMPLPSVSIIINTVDRARSLAAQVAAQTHVLALLAEYEYR